MAMQIVPPNNPPPVKHSLILRFAGIPQPNPLRPNGRVFRRLAGPVGNFTIGADGQIDQILTYEEAFILRFMRWLGEPLQTEFGDIFNKDQSIDEMKAKAEAFLPKLLAHEKACPPPWRDEQERAA